MDKPKSVVNPPRVRVVEGEQFRRWREARGLSLSQIAQHLRTSRAAVQKYDKTGLNHTQALALTAALAKLKPLSFNADDEETL